MSDHRPSPDCPTPSSRRPMGSPLHLFASSARQHLSSIIFSSVMWSHAACRRPVLRPAATRLLTVARKGATGGGDKQRFKKGQLPTKTCEVCGRQAAQRMQPPSPPLPPPLPPLLPIQECHHANFHLALPALQAFRVAQEVGEGGLEGVPPAIAAQHACSQHSCLPPTRLAPLAHEAGLG